MTNLIWISLAVVSLFLELSAPGYFFCISITAGSLAALAMSALHYNIAYQVITAAIVAVVFFIIGLLSVRVTAKKTYVPSIDRLVGQQAVVIELVDDSFHGAVKINGQVWTARAKETGISFAVNQIVTVVAVRGSYLIVE